MANLEFNFSGWTVNTAGGLFSYENLYLPFLTLPLPLSWNLNVLFTKQNSFTKRELLAYLFI